MRIKEINEVAAPPKDIDFACICIYYLLNRLPGVRTFASCSGHGKEPYNMWFFCDNIDTLSRLGRAVSPNYSDGNWKIVVDTTDTNPRGCFWLRSKNILQKKILLSPRALIALLRMFIIGLRTSLTVILKVDLIWMIY